MQDGEEGVDKAGWLNKKSPTGVPGFRVWQKRWFVLGTKSKKSDQRVLRYYKDPTPGQEVVSTLPVNRIVRVQLLPLKRKGCRFDIKMDNSRVYALDAMTPKDAREWVKAIQEAMKKKKSSITKGPASLAGQSWTKFQDLFFKYKFADEDAKEGVEEMNEKFTSDSIILSYLLQHVVDPLDYGDDDGGPPKGPGVTPALSRAASSIVMETKEPGAPSADKELANLVTLGAEKSKLPPIEEAARLKLRDEQLRKDKNLALFQKVRTAEFVRNLLHIFGTQDQVSHGLAVRLLWIVLHNLYTWREAAKQFTENVKIFCAESRFNVEVKNALFSILFTEHASIPRTLTDRVEVSFFKPYKQLMVVPAFFSALIQSPFDIRAKALEDLNTSLIGSEHNCDCLIAFRDWQKFLFVLLTDIVKQISGVEGKEGKEEEGGSDEEKQMRKCYGLVMNVFAVVHFEKFAESDEFLNIFCSSLDALFSFADATDSSWQVALVMFTSFANKIKGKKSKQLFSTDNYASKPFANLQRFYQLVKRFVFQSAHWRTMAVPGGAHSPSSLSPTPATPKLGGLSPGLAGPSPSLSSASIASGRPASPVGGDGKFFFAEAEGEGEQQYVLHKAFRKAQVIPFAEVEEFGVHFGEKGESGDRGLVELMVGLSKMLALDNFEPELHVDLNAESRAYLQKMEADSHFFEDSLQLLSAVHRSGITNGRITWRYLSHIAVRFLQAPSRQERKRITEEIAAVMSGERALGGALTRLTSNLAGLAGSAGKEPGAQGSVDEGDGFSDVLPPQLVSPAAPSPGLSPLSMGGPKPTLLSLSPVSPASPLSLSGGGPVASSPSVSSGTPYQGGGGYSRAAAPGGVTPYVPPAVASRPLARPAVAVAAPEGEAEPATPAATPAFAASPSLYGSRPTISGASPPLASRPTLAGLSSVPSVPSAAAPGEAPPAVAGAGGAGASGSAHIGGSRPGIRPLSAGMSVAVPPVPALAPAAATPVQSLPRTLSASSAAPPPAAAAVPALPVVAPAASVPALPGALPGLPGAAPGEMDAAQQEAYTQYAAQYAQYAQYAQQYQQMAQSGQLDPAYAAQVAAWQQQVQQYYQQYYQPPTSL